jgi:hypothetical protein
MRRAHPSLLVLALPLLLTACSDPSTLGDGDPDWLPPLMTAAERGDIESLETLLRDEPKPDVRDYCDWTPLMKAALNGHLEAVDRIHRGFQWPMPSLRERCSKMARYGFESNDDYEFQVRCLMESPARTLRTLNIEGDSERRKTAFATPWPGPWSCATVYHDFTERTPPQPDVILPPSKDEMGREEPPIERLDQVVSEACAYSEGTPTMLILDQLQVADFREHLRINRLICDLSWTFRGARFFANPRNLLVFLISEEPLYHSLQRVSYRGSGSAGSPRSRSTIGPSDFGLGEEAGPLFSALGSLFRGPRPAPTRSELAHILRTCSCMCAPPSTCACRSTGARGDRTRAPSRTAALGKPLTRGGGGRPGPARRRAHRAAWGLMRLAPVAERPLRSPTTRASNHALPTSPDRAHEQTVTHRGRRARGPQSPCTWSW